MSKRETFVPEASNDSSCSAEMLCRSSSRRFLLRFMETRSITEAIAMMIATKVSIMLVSCFNPILDDNQRGWKPHLRFCAISGFRRAFPYPTGMAKFDPPNSRTIAKLIPITFPSLLKSGPPEPPEVV
jgi:hypothetical protein